MSRTNKFINTEKDAINKRGLKAKIKRERKEVKNLLNMKNFSILDAETISESLNN